jgi:MFS family permease
MVKVSLNAEPTYVALIQSAAALPFLFVALPAGAIGDIFDRRRVILATEIWMATAALILTILAFARILSPLLLLALTFVLSAGDAFETPVSRAVLPAGACFFLLECASSQSRRR